MPAAARQANDPMDSQPLASRSVDTVELRQHIDRNVSDVLDAVAKAKRVTRSELVEEILLKWASAKVQEATLVTRLTRGNGAWSEPNGGRAE